MTRVATAMEAARDKHGVPTKYKPPPEERKLTSTEQVPPSFYPSLPRRRGPRASAASQYRPRSRALWAHSTCECLAQVEKELDKTGELVRAAQAELKLVHEELAIERLESEVRARRRVRPSTRTPHV